MRIMPPFSAAPARTARAVALGLALALPAGFAIGAPAQAVVRAGEGGPALGTHGIVVGSGGTPLPGVAAQSWLVADATTGQVLAAKAPHLRHRPASTLKTLTSITLMPHLDPTAEHLVTEKEMAPVYGSRAGLVAGATYTINDLWHALLLPSGNDAAAALAGAFGGVRKTVTAMRAMAVQLQAKDTTVVNPSGLDAGGQYSSAYDLALFARAAIAIPEFRQVSSTVSYDLPGKPAKPGKKRATFKIYGENRPLNHGYRGVIAGKTGYTTLAGRTFWFAATRGGHTVIVTLMGIIEPTETAAEKLMTWGLKNDGTVSAVGTLVEPLPVSAPPSPSATPGATGKAAGNAPVAASRGDGTSAAASSTTVLVLAVVVALAVLGLLLVLLRRRRRPAEQAHLPAVATPAPAAAEPDKTPTGPLPPVARPDGPGIVVAPEPLPPTGNVRVVRPPSPDAQP